MRQGKKHDINNLNNLFKNMFSDYYLEPSEIEIVWVIDVKEGGDISETDIIWAMAKNATKNFVQAWYENKNKGGFILSKVITDLAKNKKDYKTLVRLMIYNAIKRLYTPHFLFNFFLTAKKRKLQDHERLRKGICSSFGLSDRSDVKIDFNKFDNFLESILKLIKAYPVGIFKKIDAIFALKKLKLSSEFFKNLKNKKAKEAFSDMMIFCECDGMYVKMV